MKAYILENGIKLICQHRGSEQLPPFCIGFNAGALEEETYNIGTAYVVEHMVFKGTAKRTEKRLTRRWIESLVLAML